VLVTRPKLLELTFVTGLLNCGVFVTLIASARTPTDVFPNWEPPENGRVEIKKTGAAEGDTRSSSRALSGPAANTLVSNHG